MANTKARGVRKAPDKPAASLKPAASSKSVALPRVAKGRRPEFYDDPAVDQLFAIVTALTGEVSVLYDRLDSLEGALIAARSLAPGAVEAHVPDAVGSAQRTRRRDELIRRVFDVLEVYANQQRTRAPSRKSRDSARVS